MSEQLGTPADSARRMVAQRRIASHSVMSRDDTELPPDEGWTTAWAVQILNATNGDEAWALRAWNMMRQWAPGWDTFEAQAKRAAEWTRGL